MSTPRSARTLVEEALAVVRTLSVAEALALHGNDGVLFVDLREAAELARAGTIPAALHTPRGVLEFRADPSSEWHQPVFSQPGTRVLLFCAVGWRSALAARVLQEMGLPDVSHLGGGFEAWQAAGGPVAPVPGSYN
jgi:rhodanese-related sulfurtransferase